MIYTKRKKRADPTLTWHKVFAWFPVDLTRAVELSSGDIEVPTDKVAWLQVVERKRLPCGEYSEYVYREVGYE